MSISPRLSRQLDQALGKEAAEELVNWMHEMDAHRAEARETIRADMAEMRQEMQAGFATLRQEIAQLEARLERRFSDLIKWSFVFWVGAVGAVALLAGVLG